MLAQMQTEFLIASVFGHVPSRVKVSDPPPSPSTPGHHLAGLRQRQGSTCNTCSLHAKTCDTNFQPPVSLATACMVLCDVVVVMYPYVAKL